jgi:hypothetical protein
MYVLAEHTAQYSTVQHSTAQHSTAQHSTAQDSTLQHSTVQCCTVPGATPWETSRNPEKVTVPAAGGEENTEARRQ